MLQSSDKTQLIDHSERERKKNENGTVLENNRKTGNDAHSLKIQKFST